MRREWWICKNDEGYVDSYIDASDEDKECDFYHVVEIKPGEIVISREELVQAFTNAIGVDDANGWTTGAHILKAIFGDEK